MNIVSACNYIACKIDHIPDVNFPDIFVGNGCFEFECAHKTAPLCVKKSYVKSGLIRMPALLWAQHAVDMIQTTPNHWARKSVKTVADLHSGWLAACPGKGDLKINKTLAEWLPKQKNLKALLCGHKHFEYNSPFCEGVTQYVCGATFNGNAYHIRFV